MADFFDAMFNFSRGQVKVVMNYKMLIIALVLHHKV
jgi:hypothetical protein